MLQFGNMISFQIMIFLLIAMGIYLCRKGLITPDFRKGLTDLVLLFVLPFNILNSFFMEVNLEILKACAAILITSTAIQLGSCLLGPFFYRKYGPDQQVVLRYATMISNSSLIGMPLIGGLYGQAGLLYAAFYLIPLRIFMWSAGLACFTPVKSREVAKRVVTHPCILASVTGILIMAFQIPIPDFLTRTVSTISNCTTTITMLLVGSILADVNFRSVFSGLSLYFCLIRLFVIPAVVLALCMLLHVNPLVIAVAVALSGMPAGSTTALMAEKYGGDADLGAKITFLSTLLSLVTVPVWCIAVEHILR